MVLGETLFVPLGCLLSLLNKLLNYPTPPPPLLLLRPHILLLYRLPLLILPVHLLCLLQLSPCFRSERPARGGTASALLQNTFGCNQISCIYLHLPGSANDPVVHLIFLPIPIESSHLEGSICGKPKQGLVSLTGPGSDGQYTSPNHHGVSRCRSLCIPRILLFEAITKLTTHQLSLIAR